MVSNPAPRWQRLEHDERRRQILECARRLFSERNYATVSTSEIAREAGVARGLLNHYFGTKRDLYLAVIREGADRWLTMLERNAGTWLAAVGAQGLGRDPEVEAILDEARERAADRLVEALQTYEAAQAPTELRALIRAYSGLVEAASIEWLERGRLTREQVRAVLVQGFISIVRDVLPAVQQAATDNDRSERWPARPT
jgi:AcrR family transcriptional regulator